jgi:hypothetical protein
MTNEFLGFAPVSADASLLPRADAAAPALPSAAADAARTLLDEMMARVGVDGLVAAHADAGLLAQVDQHAAAVREALVHAGRAADAEGLASYARSIAAAADRMGRPVPQPGHAYVSGSAWLAAEWHLLRLVAVCMIAESAGLL